MWLDTLLALIYPVPGVAVAAILVRDVEEHEPVVAVVVVVVVGVAAAAGSFGRRNVEGIMSLSRLFFVDYNEVEDVDPEGRGMFENEDARLMQWLPLLLLIARMKRNLPIGCESVRWLKSL